MTTHHGQIWYHGGLWHYKPTISGMTYMFKTPRELMRDKKLARYRPELAFREFRQQTIAGAVSHLITILTTRNDYEIFKTPESKKRKASVESSFLKLNLWTNGVIDKSEAEIDNCFVMPNYEKNIMDLLLWQLREL